ncbi:hypothetical protein AVEN_41121-1 [Araneus ventricosus]|uniref:Uncharacterized protein n=1 Tax=Araneus ventricosus TaxID=182803 RepID=A0A4Y2SCF3_ARAVE|nr:hypothetical protein AVEN_41121-1 [Araneus ventricosus]
MSSIFQRRDSTICATSLYLFCNLNESGSAGPLPLTSAPLEPHQWPSAEVLRTGRRGALLGKRLSAGLVARGSPGFPAPRTNVGQFPLKVLPMMHLVHFEYLWPYFLPNCLLKRQISLVKYHKFHISTFYLQFQILFVTYLAKFAGVC